MSTAKYGNKLRDLRKQQAELIEQLLATGPLLRGTVSRVYTHCGKPNCWCADSPEGHPHLRITWSQKGRMITRKVPSDESSGIRNLTNNYRRFRALRRRLMEINIRIKQTLDNYETVMFNAIREKLPFLGPGRKNAAQRLQRLQKPREKRKGNIS